MCVVSPIEDCCFSCAVCSRVVCSDNETDCGHDDDPTCNPCCMSHHADELLRDALRAWGQNEKRDIA